MDEPTHHSDLKSEVAKDKPRDENGRFIHVEHTPPPQNGESEHPNPVTQFLHDEVSIHKTHKDELLDVHVGNPLSKITQLLEDIKKQKAFSFSIKGSLGVMGIVVVLGTFGILGGTKALCSKGSLTKIGHVETLTHADIKENFLTRYIPFAKDFIPAPAQENRKVLVLDNNEVIRLEIKNNSSIASLPSSSYSLNPSHYYVTGNYDACSETITVENSSDLQPTN